MSRIAKISSPQNRASESPSTVLKDVLGDLLRSRKVDVKQLSKGTGIPGPTLYRILSGVIADPKVSTLLLIANFFSVSTDQLLGTESLSKSKQYIASKNQMLPILSWKDVCHIHTKRPELTQENWEHWFPTDTQVSPLAFCLKSKKAMEPRLPFGSVLVVDPTVELMDGDFVVVHYANTDEATVRELLLDGPKKRLLSINPGEDQPEDILGNDKKILGIVFKTVLNFK